MKRTVYYFLFAASLMLPASCAKEQLAESSADASEICISASVGEYKTKATDSGFDVSDEISLWADVPQLNNVKLVAGQNGNLVCEKALYWQKDQLPFLTSVFRAIYPYNSSYPADLPANLNGNWNIDFCVQADQSTPEKLSASDFMYAASSVMSGQNVHLFFNHCMSKIRVSIKNDTERQIDEVFISDVRGKTMINASGGSTARGDLGTIKACSQTLDTKSFSPGSTFCAQAIIVPQTASPTIRITSAGREASFTVPMENTFRIGYIYDIYLTLNSDNRFSDFSMDVKNWQPDNEWEFSGMERWKLLGKGQLVDNILGGRLMDLIPVIDVDVYEDKYNPGRYSIFNPFTQDCYSHLQNTHDGRIIFNATNPGDVYIEHTSTGIVSNYYGDENDDKWDMWVYSDAGSQYSLHDGNITLPAVITRGADKLGFIGWGYDFKTTLVLPGYERVDKCFGIMPNSVLISSLEGNKGAHIEFSTCPDNDVVKIAVVEGTSLSVQEKASLLQSVLEDKYHPSYTVNVSGAGRYNTDVTADKCGSYFFLIVGVCDGKAGLYTGYYSNNVIIPEGKSVPEFNVTLRGVKHPDDNPESSLELAFNAPYFGGCRFLAVPADECGDLSDEQLLQYMDNSPNTWSISSASKPGAYEGGESSIVYTKLREGTEYKLLALFSDVFGQKVFLTANGSTSLGADEKWESIGKGVFHDNSRFFSMRYDISTWYCRNGYSSEVEILKAEGKEKYRIMHPYAEFWADAPKELYIRNNYKYNENYADYIEFYVKDIEGVNCIFYKPFSIGWDYVDDTLNGALVYEHPTGDIGIAPNFSTYVKNNSQLSPGVFNFAPIAVIGTSSYFFDFRDMIQVIYIEMPTK